MMPEPGFQKSMPYFFAALDRKANTSRFSSMPRDRSSRAPSRAWIRWSQWIEEGRVVRSRLAWMNCSRAIWAVGVLHGHPVRAQAQHGLAPVPGLGVEVHRVGGQDLLGEGEGTAETLAGLGTGRPQPAVKGIGEFQGHVRFPPEQEVINGTKGKRRHEAFFVSNIALEPRRQVKGQARAINFCIRWAWVPGTVAGAAAAAGDPSHGSRRVAPYVL